MANFHGWKFICHQKLKFCDFNFCSKLNVLLGNLDTSVHISLSNIYVGFPAESMPYEYTPQWKGNNFTVYTTLGENHL